MKNKVVNLLILFIILIPIPIFAEEFDLYSNNAIFYNLNDNTILYEKNSEEVVSIASLTKIMTAIVAIENIDNLNDTVVINYNNLKGLAEQNASVAGLKVGQKVSYKDLLYCLMLPSGADAAQALSQNIAGSEENFVKLMNQKAKELKLEKTNFENTTGLDKNNHHSTVKDVATLFQYALKNETFQEIIKTKDYVTSDNQLKVQSTIKKAMNIYNIKMDYLIGGKTGTTGDAGLCLATIAEKDNVQYMLITVKAPYSRANPYNYLDAKKIYEYYMNNYSYQDIVTKGEVLLKLKTEYTKNDYVEIIASKEIQKYLENTFQKENLKFSYEGINIITSKMNKGKHLGELKIYKENKLLEVIEIKLPEKQEFSIMKYVEDHKEIVIIPIIIVLGLIVIRLLKKKRKYNEYKSRKL